jgi:hypothetical protein
MKKTKMKFILEVLGTCPVRPLGSNEKYKST